MSACFFRNLVILSVGGAFLFGAMAVLHDIDRVAMFFLREIDDVKSKESFCLLKTHIHAAA